MMRLTPFIAAAGCAVLLLDRGASPVDACEFVGVARTGLPRKEVPAVLVEAASSGVATAQGAPSTDARAKAEQLWNRYVSLEAAFDPAVADLYADEALIRNRRTYPTGEVREATVPAAQYKVLVRQAIPLAKAKNDVSRYSGCSYAAEGARIRIVCARFSVLKDYTAPISLLVGPGPGSGWLIFEELSESRP